MRAVVVLCIAVTACIAERGPMNNRMAHSPTSYLARASRQPVNWQPWGRDAFALAARLERPILLYIGSDSCRWCAETDRAIYTDPEIGALVNALFVPIRVDRDERPDVAQRYQTAVERLAGLHGWPLTVFLTADGSAFFGGTYFPADDPVTGRGLKQLLPEIAKSYRDRRSFIVQKAALVRQLVITSTNESRGVLRPALIRQGLDALTRELTAAAEAHAVTGSVLHVQAASLLLTEYARFRDTSALALARRTLDLMLDSSSAAAAEDPSRLVQAGLVGALAKAWVLTGDTRYREAGRRGARALSRELPDVALFADQDALIVEDLLLTAATVGEPNVETHARAALDALLQRAYARGWGVRHVIGFASGGGSAGTTPTGFLQDQVAVASACLAAHQVTGDARYLELARDLAGIVERDYADSLGGYYDTAELWAPAAGGLTDRTKQPEANAAAALFFARLATVTGDAAYRQRAQATLDAFAGNATGAGVRAATFLSAARETLAPLPPPVSRP
ncbi:MAG: DUF255 domain-containing protein [Gemmatimonadales bacterium]